MLTLFVLLIVLIVPLVIFLDIPIFVTAKADSVVATLTVGKNPIAITFSLPGNMYVGNHGTTTCEDIVPPWELPPAQTSSISLINRNDEVLTIVRPGQVEDCYSGMVYSPRDGRVYVTTGGDDSVVRLFSPFPIYPTEDNPIGIEVNPDNGFLYTANYDDNDVTVIDPFRPEWLSEVDEIEFEQDESGPTDIAFNPINDRMYVTQGNSRSVTAIDTRGQYPMITLPNLIGQPYGIAFNQANGKMYVATNNDRGEGKVVTINGYNIEGEPIPVGHEAREIAYNPFYNRMYVVNNGDSTVSVIDSTDRVVETIGVGNSPVAIAYNPINARMYVTNNGSDPGTVSVIRTDDSDDDFISDIIDPNPNFSSEFQDIVESNVTTFGSIIERGNRTYFSIGDAPDPEGVIVTGYNTTGGESIDSCAPREGRANTSIHPGSVYPIKCSSYGSIFHLGPVEKGQVSTTLVAANMRTAYLDVPAGNSISFNFDTGAITAESSNTATLTVIIQGRPGELFIQESLAPGETLII